DQHRRSGESNRNDEGGLARRRTQSRRRRDCAHVAGARRGQGGAYFARALVVARRQLARSWELRAATSMARLFIAQGRRRPAREIRAPVWFTQGFDTLDLRQAKSLLDELAPWGGSEQQKDFGRASTLSNGYAELQ